jgi:hypothetical protein
VTTLVIDSVRLAADAQRAEAKQLMNRLLGIPEGMSSGVAERLVDCIIGAATLEAALVVRATFPSAADEVKS